MWPTSISPAERSALVPSMFTPLARRPIRRRLIEASFFWSAFAVPSHTPVIASGYPPIPSPPGCALSFSFSRRPSRQPLMALANCLAYCSASMSPFWKAGDGINPGLKDSQSASFCASDSVLHWSSFKSCTRASASFSARSFASLASLPASWAARFNSPASIWAIPTETRSPARPSIKTRAPAFSTIFLISFGLIQSVKSAIDSITTPTRTRKAEAYAHFAAADNSITSTTNWTSQYSDIWRVQKFIIGCLLVSAVLKFLSLVKSINDYNKSKKKDI
jgi:hypothetical protein